MSVQKSRKKSPLLYKDLERPFLLDTQEFAKAIKSRPGVVFDEGSSTMHRVRNRMDVVLIGPQGANRQPTVRQPLPYVLGLEQTVKRYRTKPIARIATIYSVTDDAKDRIMEGRLYFQNYLDEHTQDGFVYSGDATSLLNLSPETVYHWYRSGVVTDDEVDKRIRGPARELFIARSAIERLCEWRLPEALRESGIPGLPYQPEVGQAEPPLDDA